jgi:anti-sigma factor RsiW
VTAGGACPGDALTALVDGELDHAGRERVLAHLAHCARCRVEVEGQRRLKGRLAVEAEVAPMPSAALTERLLALAVPGVEPTLRLPAAPVRPVGVRPAPRPGGAPRPPGTARRAGRLPRRAAVGSCLVVLGVTTALALGGAGSAPSTPIDPTTDAFVADFASTRSEVPFADPAVSVAQLTPR